MLVKIHPSYRTVVAICDKDIFGKIFEEGEKQIDLTGDFFKGEEKTEEQVREIMKEMKTEDATFNIVGEKSCRMAIELNLSKEQDIIKIQGIPIILVLN